MHTAILWPILAHVRPRVLPVCLAEPRAHPGGAGRPGAVWLLRVRARRAAGHRPDHPQTSATSFELPVVAYAAVLFLMQLGTLGTWDVAFAWVFFAGRVIHTGVQTLTDDVPLRGRVFLVNALGCAALVGHLALVAAHMA